MDYVVMQPVHTRRTVPAKQWILMFKLTATLLLISFLGVHANGYSQPLRITLQDQPIEELFRAIQQQTDYAVLYSDKHIKGVRVTLRAVNDEMLQVLNRAFANTGLTYEVEGKQIVVSRPLADPAIPQDTLVAVTGYVGEDSGPLAGATVRVPGTNVVTTTDDRGRFHLKLPPDALLVISSIGFEEQRVQVNNRRELRVILQPSLAGLDEVVVVGYGTQRKSDITGAVASFPTERLENTPNVNVTQAIQGAIPGVMVQNSSAGAEPGHSLMVRGRNSIKASNSPLVVVDGIAGSLNDVNPNDVASIEVLKDASAAAIYGSRGSNGVILVTTKSGTGEKTKLKYSGFYATQRFTKIPDLMDGQEFYDFKMERAPDAMTPSELQVYQSGEWVDWLDLALRNGRSTQHNLSLSGGFRKTKYYLSGSLTDVTGLAVNDDYKRISSRINVDTDVKNWLTVGTRTQIAYSDASGIAPSWSGSNGIFWFNPLTRAYDESGNLTIYPWPDDTFFRNPLQGLLAKDVDENYQVVSNNYAVVDFPFVKGLQYRINTGIRLGFGNSATYYGTDTQTGYAIRGDASTGRGLSRNMVVENIVNYNRDFGKHSVFVTGVYSFENARSGTNSLSAQGFPNDFLTWYGASQAELVVPGFSNTETTLLSTMGRINYSYDSRYLLTLTGRSDAFSGFGAQTKRGFFPSVAVGWNIINEPFFQGGHVFSQLKLRASLGLNGNQAVGAYETISRLSAENMVGGNASLPGYIPSKMGQDNLGWESTRTLNVGLDFGVLNNRLTGDINLFKSNTIDLLLDRTISPVSAFTSVAQNIGETENRGLEMSFSSTNLAAGNFTWKTNGNILFVKNKIVSLYGYRDANGREVDDVANSWFIGKPIRVIYNFVWDGVWQLDEAAEAAAHNTQPGYIKIKDISGPDGVPDGVLSPEYDRAIIGQSDPKYIWGMNNAFTYRNFSLNIFLHGMHGVTKRNGLMSDDVGRTVRNTTIKKNWWTPDNPTNDWYMNAIDANRQEGYSAYPYEKAGFVRVKDISLAFEFPKKTLENIGVDRLQLFMTGRNLFTITDFGGMDPELSSQEGVPMQKEYVFGINFEF